MKYHSSTFLCASLGGVALISATNGQKNNTVFNSGFLTAMNSGIVPTPIVENTFLVQLPSNFDIKTMKTCTSYDVDEDGKVPHEQVLGCSLFHDIATMGAYKADEDLNTRPTEGPLTGAIFDTAGIAQMILDGCFSVNLVESLQENSYSYSTLSTYESQVSTSYSLDVSAKASYATVSASAGYQKKTNTFVQENGVNQASGGDVHSEYVFARMKNRCIADGIFRDYMTKDAQTLFNNMMQYPNERAYFQQWRERYGLVVPSEWYFGAYRGFSLAVNFISTEQVDSYQTSEAMSAAMSVDYGAFSSEVSVEMEQAFSETMKTYDSSATLNVDSSSNFNCPEIWESGNRNAAIDTCAEKLSSNILNWGTAIKVGRFTPMDYGVTEAQNKSKMAYTMYEVGTRCFQRTNHFVIQEKSSGRGKYLYCKRTKDQGCTWKEYIDLTFRTQIESPTYDHDGFRYGYEAFDINDESVGWLDRVAGDGVYGEAQLSEEGNNGSKHWGILKGKYLCDNWEGKEGKKTVSRYSCMTKEAIVAPKDWVEVEQIDVHGLMVDFNGFLQLCCPAGMDC